MSRGSGKRTKMKPDDKMQSKAFIEKAREVGADEKSSAADELLKRLAKRPPKPRAKKEKSSK